MLKYLCISLSSVLAMMLFQVCVYAENGLVDHSAHQGHQEHTGQSEHQGHDKHANHSAHQGHQQHTGQSEHQGHDEHANHSTHQGHQQHTGQSEDQEHDKHADHSSHQGHQQMGHDPNNHGDMLMTRDSMVMHANSKRLPEDCLEISKDYKITVEAGTQYAKPYPATIFGFKDHQINVEPCSRITVNFVNKDDVRHQWMVHGLPKYLYPKGMFHMETAGNSSVEGVIIVPSDDKTYLIHCDISQHMEKGMKAQLVVGKGSGNLPSIPGVSGALVEGEVINDEPYSNILLGLFFVVTGNLLVLGGVYFSPIDTDIK